METLAAVRTRVARSFSGIPRAPKMIMSTLFCLAYWIISTSGVPIFTTNSKSLRSAFRESLYFSFSAPMVCWMISSPLAAQSAESLESDYFFDSKLPQGSSGIITLKICSLALSFLAQSTACTKAVLACSEKSVQIRIFLYSDIDYPGQKYLYIIKDRWSGCWAGKPDKDEN